MKTLYVSLSALVPSEYRKYVKKWDTKKYESLFRRFSGDRKRYRLYFPLKKVKATKAKVPARIVDELLTKGYQVEDYKMGLARDTSGKRKNLTSIGKLLSNEALKLFVNDPQRQGVATSQDDYMVVVSRHPYDIASMSTGRGWTSCQDLRAKDYQVKFVATDIKKGSLVAYLVKKIKDKNHKRFGQFDVNIENPVARIKIVRYENPENPDEFYLVSSKIYGNVGGLPQFKETVDDFCAKASKSANQNYEVDDQSVYLDSGLGKKLFIIKQMDDLFSTKDNMLNGRVIYDYTFKLSGINLKQIVGECINRQEVPDIVLQLLRNADTTTIPNILKFYALLSSEQRTRLARQELPDRRLILASIKAGYGYRITHGNKLYVLDHEIIKALVKHYLAVDDGINFWVKINSLKLYLQVNLDPELITYLCTIPNKSSDICNLGFMYLEQQAKEPWAYQLAVDLYSKIKFSDVKNRIIIRFEPPEIIPDIFKSKDQGLIGLALITYKNLDYSTYLPQILQLPDEYNGMTFYTDGTLKYQAISLAYKSFKRKHKKVGIAYAKVKDLILSSKGNKEAHLGSLFSYMIQTQKSVTEVLEFFNQESKKTRLKMIESLQFKFRIENPNYSIAEIEFVKAMLDSPDPELQRVMRNTLRGTTMQRQYFSKLKY